MLASFFLVQRLTPLRLCKRLRRLLFLREVRASWFNG